MDWLIDFIGNLIKSPFICLGWIIVGAVAGAIARLIVGKRRGNACSDFILGIMGAIVGGALSGLFGLVTPGGGIELVLANLIIATGGAVVLIVVWRLITGRR
jgi:uncharacterized membrane protein YeaQ/YmgE (transglycosylase-associated protein family)